LTFGLEIVNVGKRPDVLTTRGLTNSALLINTASRDLSLIRTAPLEGSLVTNLPSIQGMDAIASAPFGQSAVVFHNFGRVAASAQTSEIPESAQDVLLVGLTSGEERSFQRIAGYMPREVEYDQTGAMAYIISKDGISRADFSNLTQSNAPLPLILYPGGGPEVSRDVDVAPTGQFAMVRPEPTAGPGRDIWIMDLSGENHRQISLPAAAYDLDLSPVGDYAVAVLPTTRQMAIIPAAGPTDTPYLLKDLPGVYAGQAEISASGRLIALFSNQSGEEKIGVYDRGSDMFKVIPLHKEVKTVAFTPDEQLLVVIHQKKDGEPENPDDYEDVADHSHGYSLVRISDGFVKQQLTLAPPEPFMIHPDGSRIYLLQRDDDLGVREVEVIYTDSFVVSSLKLASPPVSLGYIPESDLIFVSEDHPAGRIAFIDANEQIRTVTGFELNDWIVE
jgi:hypothetical protein